MLGYYGRKSGTKTNGASFDQATILKVWEKAQIIWGKPAHEIRKDKCGAEIKLSAYGNRNSDYGWEVDHVTPVSKGGSDDLYNLQPLQWANNVSKSDGPNYSFCKVTF